jgi:hypothetical protein
LAINGRGDELMTKELAREYAPRDGSGPNVRAVWFDGDNVEAVASVLGGAYVFHQWVKLPFGLRCALFTRIDRGGDAFAAGVVAWIVAIPSVGYVVLTDEEFWQRYKLPPRRVDLQVQVWVEDGCGTDGWVLERVRRAIEDGEVSYSRLEVSHGKKADG